MVRFEALGLPLGSAPAWRLWWSASGSMMTPLSVCTLGLVSAACEAAGFHSGPMGARTERSNCSRLLKGKGTPLVVKAAAWLGLGLGLGCLSSSPNPHPKSVVISEERDKNPSPKPKPKPKPKP